MLEYTPASPKMLSLTADPSRKMSTFKYLVREGKKHNIKQEEDLLSTWTDYYYSPEKTVHHEYYVGSLAGWQGHSDAPKRICH